MLAVVVSCILILVAPYAWYSIARSSKRSARLPPGSLGLPFIGETLDFFRCINSNKPSDFYLSREAKYGKVFKTSLFGGPVVVVSPPSGVKLLFTSHNKLVRQSFPLTMYKLFPENALISSSENEAKAIRHVYSEFLGPDAMSKYASRTSKLVQEHFDTYWKGEQVLAYPLIKKALFSIVCNIFLSMNNKEEEIELLEPFDDLSSGLVSVPIDLPWSKFRKAKAARVRLCDVLGKHIAKRRLELKQGEASANQDLLSVLITTPRPDGALLNDKEIKDNLIAMLVGGHDTNASSLSMTIMCLAENPACFDELRRVHLEIASTKLPGEPLNWEDLKQMKYTWRVVQEAMRLRPSATGVFRKALVDFEIDGFTVPKGWQVFATVYSSNMKEQFFRDPHMFDPSRFEGSGPIPYTHFPFGGGPRMCAGIEQAKMQSLVFLHHLVTQYKWTLINPDEPVILLPAAIPAQGLPLKLVKCT